MGSKSKSSQSQTSTNTDARVVADGGALGLSGNNNTITMTDSGLVSAAFDYLGQADAMITDRNNSTLTIAGNTAQAVIDAGVKAGADAVSAATNTLSTMATAQRQQSGASVLDNSQIMAALIGAVALMAVKG